MQQKVNVVVFGQFRSCLCSANDVDVRASEGGGAAAVTEAAEVEQMMMEVTAEAAAMMMAMDT